VRKVLPYLTQGLLLCLGGFAFFYLLRKASCSNSPEQSASFETAMGELNRWKRSVDAELESQFDRIRSIAGRVDRSKRKERDPDGQGEPAAPVAVEEGDAEQARLNGILAKRFHGA
jgi:hypothetical protein